MDTPIIFQDNTSTIKLVTTGGGKFRNKHLRAQKGVLLEGYTTGRFLVEYINTERMIADMFTKPLEGYKFYKFMRAIMGDRSEIINRISAAGVRENNRACDPSRACKCTKKGPAEISTDGTANNSDNPDKYSS
jgi:hypothetical protein